MSLLDTLRGKPDPKRFARLMIDAIRRHGDDRAVEFNESNFELILDDGEQPSHFFLGNAHREYCDAPRSDKRKILDAYARTVTSTSESDLPTSFDQARPNLLPRVRQMAYYSVLRLSFADQADGQLVPPYETLNDEFAVEVVYDMPDAIRSLNQSDLDDWGVTLSDALTAARDNLWRISNETWQDAGQGVWVSPWQDSHDASRLYLHDLLWQLQVEGDHIALLPSRDVLIVTGSDNAAGLTHAAQLARQVLENEARPMSGVALRLNDQTWEPFLPPNDHPAHVELANLAAESVGQLYAEQKQLLDQAKSDDTPLIVAGYMGTQRESDNKLETFSIWPREVATLLPRTDRVVFMQTDDQGEGQVLGAATWDRVEEVVGDLMRREPDLSPPRWRVESFPDDAQLDALGLEPLEV